MATFGTCVMSACLAPLVLPTLDYIEDQAGLTTPGLGVSGEWRAIGLIVGIALLLAICALRLLAAALRPRQLLAAVAIVGGVLLTLQAASSGLEAIGNWNLLVFFLGIVFVSMLAGVPIAFAFGAGTLAYLAFAGDLPMSVAVDRLDAGMGNPLLLAVPLFVFLGLLIEMTGMARAMVGVLAMVLGGYRGGLSYVLLAAMYLISGISGAKAADMAAVAPALFPEMKRRGAHPGDLLALLATSSAMSETIPPSLVLITIGTVAGVSIAALFTGGLLPALVVAAFLCVVCFIRSRSEQKPAHVRPDRRTVLRALAAALPALMLPFLIRAAVVDGVATSTEVATIGIAYAAAAGLLIHRELDWRRLGPMLVETASLSGAVLIVVGLANGMAWILAQSNLASWLTAAMADAPGGKATFMAGSIVAFMVFGSVLEGIPAIVLFAPLLFPLARALHIHEVHYAMVAISSMRFGLFTPPFGVGYYTACAIGRVSPEVGIRRIWPCLLALLAGILVVAAVPWISIGLLE